MITFASHKTALLRSAHGAKFPLVPTGLLTSQRTLDWFLARDRHWGADGDHDDDDNKVASPELAPSAECIYSRAVT
jgi:hypothetical protein